LDVGLHAVDEHSRRWAKVRAGGCKAVIALAGGGGARLGVALGGEGLPDDGGADDFAVLGDQTAFALLGNTIWPMPIEASG
jgi:hypothetical protein